MPALEAAKEAVAGLNKNSINEIKAYNSPPKEVGKVMGAVMTYLKEGTEWAQIKKVMNDQAFMSRILNFDMDNIPDSVIKKIAAYTSKDDFLPGYMKKKSEMAGVLCLWVRSVEEYHKALQIVLPKRKKLEQAKKELAEKEARLAKMKAEFDIIKSELDALNENEARFKKESDENKRALDQLQTKIERGEKLISGLGDEKIRWESSLVNFRVVQVEIVGDCILAAAYMSYCGPFPADFRQKLHSGWMRKIKEEAISHKRSFNFSDFLVDQETIRVW